MTDIPAEPANAPTDIPAPLAGCLYCHAEGTITQTEGRKLFGLVGSNLPTLTCSECHSTALFEANGDRWRIKYKNVNRAPRFYYVMIHLGHGGWLHADEALGISVKGFVQRQRVQQAQRGDLSWLVTTILDPLPPLMAPDEVIYLKADSATFQQVARSGTMLNASNDNVLDSGEFYVTDRKLHLLGHRRDWSHKLVDIQRIEHNESCWRIYVGDSEQHYQGANVPDQIDAQLFTAIVKQLTRRDE